jgi:hypothetical protein
MKLHELGNLKSLPNVLGLGDLCVCGESEIYHNTFPGEDGRCTVYGSTCRQFTPARKPASSVVFERPFDIGDVVEYRDDETGELMVATIIDFGAPGWFDVTHDGRPEDDAGIHEELIVRVVPFEEWLVGAGDRKAA